MANLFYRTRTYSLLIGSQISNDPGILEAVKLLIRSEMMHTILVPAESELASNLKATISDDKTAQTEINAPFLAYRRDDRILKHFFSTTPVLFTNLDSKDEWLLRELVYATDSSYPSYYFLTSIPREFNPYLEALQSIGCIGLPSELITSLLKAMPQQTMSVPVKKVPERPRRYILSIDGGGIRGVIPALLLIEIEDAIKQQGLTLVDVFDIFAGTSTGGILALGLTVPSAEGRQPKNNARTLCRLYETQGPTIFPSKPKRYPLWCQLLRIPLNVVSIKGVKLGDTICSALTRPYSDAGLQSALNEYFTNNKQEIPVRFALKDVVVTTYDMRTKTVKQITRHDPVAKDVDISMARAAYATAAAPTFFKPLKLEVPNTEKYLGLIDGGVFANNPALCAYSQARRLFPDDDYVMVSLGTGSAGFSPWDVDSVMSWPAAQWTVPIINTMFSAGGDIVDRIMRLLLPNASDGSKRYFRFQVNLGKVSDSIDDATNVGNLSTAVRNELSNGLSDRIAEFVDLVRQQTKKD